jgi:SPP1 gp7 family putative phage head morphogenesis protein
MILLDSITRHQIFVQRYAAGREVHVAATMEALVNQINERLASNITQMSQGRIEAILFDLETYSRETLKTMSKGMSEEALRFAEYEVGFNQRMMSQGISATLATPTPDQIRQAMQASVMQVEVGRGYTIQKALQMFEGKKASQIVGVIRDGVALGDTRDQISKSLMSFKDMGKQQARTLARTITNHASAESRMLFMKENEDVIEGYRWVSTLDSKTSLVCASRDGTVYPITDDPVQSPKPPAHFSCRSTIVPSVKPEFDLTGGRRGVRPSRGADGTKVVGGGTDYQSWLARQPKAFQEEVLGKQRAELFRRGDLKLSAFVDSGGGTINLERLRELEPLAFQKADI